MATSDSTLVFDPLGPPGTVPTWADAEVLLVLQAVGRQLLGPEWQEHIAEASPMLHMSLTLWIGRVVDPEIPQPDQAVARLHLVEAARAARR